MISAVSSETEKLKTVPVLQHVGTEGPHVLGERLQFHGISWKSVRCDLGEPVPRTLGDAPALIVMGGPMGVYEADRYPHLSDELRLIERAAADDKPIIGICLGSQLVAAALGGRVEKSGRIELGWKPVTRTQVDDPVFGTLPDRFTPLHWHGDVFSLPPGATALASSEMTPLQAFRHGRTRYGVLFHMEATLDLVHGMAQAFPDDLVRSGEPLLDEAPARLAALRPLAERAFDAWIHAWLPAAHLARSTSG